MQFNKNVYLNKVPALDLYVGGGEGRPPGGECPALFCRSNRSNLQNYNKIINYIILYYILL